MKKEFIPYEEALALKALGFAEDCLRWYDVSKCRKLSSEDHATFHPNFIKENVIASPLYQQAFRWFREEHDLNGVVDRVKSGAFVYRIDYFPEHVDIHKKLPWGNKSYNYQDAEIACINKLIEIVKNRKL